MEAIDRLKEIVGKDFVFTSPEETLLYGRDGGSTPPRRVDAVVIPGSVEEVQEIVKFASKNNIPVTPAGAGLTLNGLTIPLHGGIVVDMRRMNRILEVNRLSRYVVLEAGVTQGFLLSYLKENHPDLMHSIPEAPPTATVVGNLLIKGHGTQAFYGENSDMINGLEVVLPTGELLYTGSLSVSKYWFTKGPLPDLTGLFISWFGTTGIVTKASLRLFPRPAYRDSVMFMMDQPEYIPELIYEITATRLFDNIGMLGQDLPEYLKGHQFVGAMISGNYEEEIKLKKEIISRVAEKFGGKVLLIPEIPDSIKKRFMEEPPFAAVAADFRKGGGFQYCGAMIPLEKVPEAWRKGEEIAHKYGFYFSCANQVLAFGHEVMFGFNYSFNRADPEEVERVGEAMKETNDLVLSLEGIPWKADFYAQQRILAKMFPETYRLIQKIRKTLDPAGIMNPGNWEKEE